eukprot:scaffold40464_cov155-Skeletonema_dohrnii-CCMP3373.AAC.2
MRFSVCTIATAVAGSLAILPECKANCPYPYHHCMCPVRTSEGEVTPMPSSGRQLAAEQQTGGTVVGHIYHPLVGDSGRTRTLTTVEEAKDKEPHNSLHINATGLTANCEGCKVAMALIQTSLCGTTDAHDSALQVPLEDSLTYIADENGSTGGWKTQHF